MRREYGGTDPVLAVDFYYSTCRLACPGGGRFERRARGCGGSMIVELLRLARRLWRERKT
jgi:hypothetical protein